MNSLSPSKFLGIPENFSAHGGQVDHLIDVVHWLMIGLFVGWTLFFLFCLFRFRQSANPKASYSGVKSHLSSHIEVGIVILEAVLLLGFAFPLWKDRTDTWETVQERDPVRVRVIGYQFGWTYHYPGEDGIFGRIDHGLKTGNTDAGIDLDDPNGLDDFTSSVLSPALAVVATTLHLNTCLASWMASEPTPPAPPVITTRSPSLTPPRWSACSAVIPAKGKEAAC